MKLKRGKAINLAEIKKGRKRDTSLIEDMGKVPVGNCGKCIALCGNAGHPITIRCRRFIPRIGSQPKEKIVAAVKVELDPGYDEFYKKLKLQMKSRIADGGYLVLELYDAKNQCVLDAVSFFYKEELEKDARFNAFLAEIKEIMFPTKD